MADSPFRWRYYLASTAIILIIVGAYQLWQGRFDERLVVSIGILYFVVLAAIDFVRYRFGDSSDVR